MTETSTLSLKIFSKPIYKYNHQFHIVRNIFHQIKSFTYKTNNLCIQNAKTLTLKKRKLSLDPKNWIKTATRTRVHQINWRLICRSCEGAPKSNRLTELYETLLARRTKLKQRERSLTGCCALPLYHKHGQKISDSAQPTQNRVDSMKV